MMNSGLFGRKLGGFSVAAAEEEASAALVAEASAGRSRRLLVTGARHPVSD